jgi:predicted aspartyl protease
MLTAQGEAEFDIYLGKVRIGGEDFDIPVHIGQKLSEILLSRQWLKNQKLLVYMPSHTISQKI